MGKSLQASERSKILGYLKKLGISLEDSEDITQTYLLGKHLGSKQRLDQTIIDYWRQKNGDPRTASFAHRIDSTELKYYLTILNHKETPEDFMVRKQAFLGNISMLDYKELRIIRSLIKRTGRKLAAKNLSLSINRIGQLISEMAKKINKNPG